MTNKKSRAAAVSAALTACVAVQPLAAHAADSHDVEEPAAEPKQSENAEEARSAQTSEQKADGANQEDSETKEAFGDNVDVKYDTPATKNDDGSSTAKGDVVKKDEPPKNDTTDDDKDTKKEETPSDDGKNEGGQEGTGSNEGTTDPSADDKGQPGETGGDTAGSTETGKDRQDTPTSDTGKDGQDTSTSGTGKDGQGTSTPDAGKDGTSGDESGKDTPASGLDQTEKPTDSTEPAGEDQEDTVKIGDAQKTEKDDKTETTVTPNPGAQPIPDETKPSTSEKNSDGSTDIITPTVTPGKETTTTTGSGSASADTKETTETPKDQINLKDELGENPDIKWDVKAGDKVAGSDYKVSEVKNDGNKQTLTMVKEKTESGSMSAEDIAKLLDADKPTVNQDGSYTLTRTETYTDADGNVQTRTTYITVVENNVTIKTTTVLTVSREKNEVRDEQSASNDFKLPDITVKSDSSSFEISSSKLDELIKQDKNPTVKDNRTTYKVSEGDLEYTIIVDKEAAGKLSAEEIAAKLGKDYRAENGKVYYVGNNEHAELSIEQEKVLREKLSIRIEVVKTSDGSKETIDKEKTENEVKADAIKKALLSAAKKAGVPDSDLDALQKKLDNEIKASDSGTFEFSSSNGGKYSFDYVGEEVKLIDSKPAADPTIPGKNPEDITDVRDNTVAGSAYVTNGTVSWSKSDQTGEYSESDKLDLVGGNPLELPEGAKVLEKDSSGNVTKYEVTTTGKNGEKITKTYVLKYESATLTQEEKEALAWDRLAEKYGKSAEELKKEGYSITNVDFADGITKVSWTVTHRTEGTDTKTETPNKTLVAKGSTTWEIDDTKGTIKTEKETFTDLKKTGENTYTRTVTDANGQKTTTTITVIESTPSADEIKAMLAEEFKLDASQITLSKDGKTATYKDDTTTITIDCSQLSKKTLQIETSVSDSVSITGSFTSQAELDAAYDAVWKLIVEKRSQLKEGETLSVGDFKVTDKTVKEDIIKYITKAISPEDMTKEALIKALQEQERVAKSTKTTVNKGTPYEETLDNYYSGKEDFKHSYSNDPATWGDYINHLDLASGSKLDLLPDKDGNVTTTDCVLISNGLSLEWNYDAGKLVRGEGNTKVGLDNKISLDTEDGNGSHYEYDRGSPNNNPTRSAFYKLTGTVVYDALKDENNKVQQFKKEKDAVNAYLKATGSSKDYDSLTQKEKDAILNVYVVRIGKTSTNNTGSTGYQVYLKSSSLSAYGYMTRDANTCVNGTAYRQNGQYSYTGGYDLMISQLTQVSEGKVIGQTESTIQTIVAPLSISRTQNLTHSSLLVNKKTTATSTCEDKNLGSGYRQSGKYTYNYKQDFNWKDDCSDGVPGTSTGSYKSFVNRVHEFFSGEKTDLAKDEGSFTYRYTTENDAELNAESKTETVAKTANVTYTYKTVETKDVLIPGQDIVHVDPETPSQDDCETTPAKPTPVQTPVQPIDAHPAPVQDATPDAVILPAAPERPAVLNMGALPKTGVNWKTAISMALSGISLLAAGAYTTLTYKEKH